MSQEGREHAVVHAPGRGVPAAVVEASDATLLHEQVDHAVARPGVEGDESVLVGP